MNKRFMLVLALISAAVIHAQEGFNLTLVNKTGDSLSVQRHPKKGFLGLPALLPISKDASKVYNDVTADVDFTITQKDVRTRLRIISISSPATINISASRSKLNFKVVEGKARISQSEVPAKK